MNKWQKAAEKRKEEIEVMTQESIDLRTLLDNLPAGQRKNLLKNEICGAILRKHGITE